MKRDLWCKTFKVNFLFGHSHKPLTEVRDGILYLNPAAPSAAAFARPAHFALRGCLRAPASPTMRPWPALLGCTASDALDRTFANRPVLVDVVVTPEAISSDGKTGLAWVPDLQPLAAWDDAERKWRGTEPS